jgi:hypothetical protein
MEGGRRASIDILLLASLILGSALACTTPRQSIETPVTARLPVTIDLGFAGHDDRLPYVIAHIDAHPLRLMLDTGHYEAISLTPEALYSLSVEYLDRSVSYADTGGSVHSARRFAVPTLRLGQLAFRDVTGVENVSGPAGFDGTIGLPLLQGFQLSISHADAQVTLNPPGTPPPAGPEWTRVGLRRDLRVPIRLARGAVSTRIGIDTGHSTMMVPARSLLARRIRRSDQTGTPEITINERTGKPVAVYQIEHLYIDDYDLGPQTCVIAAEARFMRNGMLGFGLFRSNDIIIDFLRNELWLRPRRR